MKFKLTEKQLNTFIEGGCKKLVTMEIQYPERGIFPFFLRITIKRKDALKALEKGTTKVKCKKVIA